VEGRERWQALQAHLSGARQALTHGDHFRAMEEVDAALAIDPDFAAARALRDRIVAADPRVEQPLAMTADGRVSPTIVDFPAARTVAAPPRPLVSAEGYARFEERARRRRIERRTQAARAAIADRRLRDARNAIAEIAELDPAAPEIAVLRGALEAARRARRVRPPRWWRGPYVAAAAAFVTILLAASWLEKSNSLLSYPMSIVTALVSTAQPTSLTATSADDNSIVGTSGDDAEARPGIVGADAPAPVAHSSLVKLKETMITVARMPFGPPPAASTPTPAVVTPPPTVASGPLSTAAVSQPALPPPPSLTPAPAPSAPAADATVAAADSRVSDEALVRRTLQEYKSAYEALDARSAQAVWPVVNERALARAFDGLESQRLVFDACDVRVSGDAAAAICRGSARYVAKVGSREPRTEPRVWNFALRRHGADWKIETARAER
jgi:hypothetical protein